MKTQNNYHHVVPDSQFYTDLEQIITSLKSGVYDREYMIIGLQNSIKNGYNLRKTSTTDRKEQETKNSSNNLH